MIVLIAYDIPSNRRRARVSKLLTGYGERIQFSVFECHLTTARYLELRNRLVPLVQPRLDRVSFYPLCQACFDRAETLGPPYASTLEC